MNLTKLIALPLLLMSLATSAQASLENFSEAVDSTMATIFGPFVSTIFYSVEINGTSFLLIAGWLLVAALIFSFYFGFVQFRKFGLALDIVRGKYTDPDQKEDGEVSHFQALTTALSGTVGLGNIAGVGAALAIGGPGATFWMILVGLLGMASKFVECTLGVKYRTILPSGVVSGGPMYYLSRGLKERGFGGLGKFLAVGFAIMVILGSLGGGNMFQANQAHAMLNYAFGVPAEYGVVTGVILAALTFSVIFGGMPSISSVTEKLVPWMAVLYITMSLFVIGTNLDHIGPAFSSIIDGAFSAEGVTGGFIGALIQGLKRATFSNEAGVGSAAIAHSAVKTNEPVTEGLVSLLEPLIDTVVICTMTALVITIAGLNTAPFDGSGLTGVQLTAASFTSAADWFKYPLAIAVILFAFSTMISWSYYGLKGWTYLVGEGAKKEIVFKAVFCFFVIIGATVKFGFVIDFSDAAIFAMSIFNIIGLYFLMPIVKEEFNSFVARVKSGEIKKYK
ncbi:alanine/glycine:cation symporter family protein [Phocoenobacter skyensis]|uniref:Alanine or glycine:cation symporter, AGCS family n=1 Tax=Phocoenobacter skyensis TaxID=97481 RepID=A0A1H7YDJ2_9PAST|nr:alanine/glycine:cation symporter family protein [Pasteurella skyensis]MDP8079719.1 alanine/glycine:cation symporter family protein [Pasteurella skyensis]MDP8085706.1 alanine/glycine:cation symporter family protein [Pasteurella skyensis]MDP8162965.1 alanine/glycine:cation symporter family protein [Pasteurella skyensis]MDP8170928.1 alanine/glycine:cation symporter family protein [Pasteurella skyensis]MDP8172883.1 alanine/glycine:cation symporter family protein [Pasteurella skyensis]